MSDSGTKRGKKTELDEEEDGNEEEEVYQLPEDLVSDVKPCQYLAEIYQEPITNFQEMGNRVPEFLKLAKYSEIPKYMNLPITESYKMFINAINQVDRSSIRNPPKNIADFTNYITSLIPQKACYQIASAWPPAIPRISNTMEPLAAIIIKMLSEANDPVNILRLFSLAVFPQVWTSKTCTKNPVLLAISPCKYKGKEGHWALILKESNTFRIIGKTKKGELIIKAEGEASKCVKSKDKKSLIVKGPSGRVSDFEPLDQSVMALWTHLKLSEDDDDKDKDDKDKDDDDDMPKEIPFTYFLTQDYEFFPDEFYPAFYSAFEANDLIVAKTIIESNPPYKVVKAMLNATLYTRKVHTVFGAVVGKMIEPDDLNPMAVYSQDSFYRKFVHALWEKFGSEYIRNFMRKLVAYIDKQSGCNEKVFFNVVKYIMKSSQYIPIQIRHFASTIRSYATTKFNSRGLVYILLGGFFGLDFICPVIAHPEKYMDSLSTKKTVNKGAVLGAEAPKLELKHPHVAKQVSELLQYLFHGAFLPSQHEALNKRIKHHTIKEMEEFLFSLGDISGDIPAPTPPTKEELVPCLEKMMHHVLDNADDLRRIYDEAQITSITTPPQVGLNFAATFTDFFRQAYDRGYKRVVQTGSKKVKPNPLKFPALPIYGLLPAQKAKPRYGFDDGQSVVSRGFTAPPSPPPSSSMKLPQKPKSQKRNPLARVQDKISDSGSTLSAN